MAGRGECAATFGSGAAISSNDAAPRRDTYTVVPLSQHRADLEPYWFPVCSGAPSHVYGSRAPEVPVLIPDRRARAIVRLFLDEWLVEAVGRLFTGRRPYRRDEVDLESFWMDFSAHWKDAWMLNINFTGEDWCACRMCEQSRRWIFVAHMGVRVDPRWCARRNFEKMLQLRQFVRDGEQDLRNAFLLFNLFYWDSDYALQGFDELRCLTPTREVLRERQGRRSGEGVLYFVRHDTDYYREKSWYTWLGQDMPPRWAAGEFTRDDAGHIIFVRLRTPHGTYNVPVTPTTDEYSAAEQARGMKLPPGTGQVIFVNSPRLET